MIEPELPLNETERLDALRSLEILDTPTEERFDRLTRLVKAFFGTEIVFISLVDANRQWFKSKQGSEACSTERGVSFCGHAILQNDIFEIPDACQDIRFADNPLVTGEPFIRFYAGAPLKSSDGFPIGTLCLIDSKPKRLSDSDRSYLRDFADAIEDELHAVETARLKSLLDDSEKRNRDTVQLLLQKEKLASIGQLAAGIAHEINNPIGFVISNVAQLSVYADNLIKIINEFEIQLKSKFQQEEITDVISLLERIKELNDFDYIKSDMSDLLADCQHGATRIRDIVISLKNFSDTDNGVGERTWIDINACIRSALSSLNRELEKINTINVDDNQNLPQLLGNESQLIQVFNSILINAVHAVEDKIDNSSINVAIHTDQENIIVQIRDNGCGIDTENRPYIFDPFFTTKAVGQGTGLGLHIAYDIVVNKHGGKLFFDTEVDEGTCFTILIPIDAKLGNIHSLIPS